MAQEKHQMIEPILEKLIQGEPLSNAELKEVRNAFHDSLQRKEIDTWLEKNWDMAPFTDIEMSYNSLKQNVLQYEYREQLSDHPVHYLKNLSRFYRKIAATLFIPLILGISLFWYFSQNKKENFYIAEAPLGQKAKIELPDGSQIWLNSGSRIRYSSEFNKKNRYVELKGEAFFDVAKNLKSPFFVYTPQLTVKVTGTRFNLNAYGDESVVETALIEGKVNVILNNKDEDTSYQLTPGKMLAYSKETRQVSTAVLDEEAATAWKDNRLVFINDEFSKLARKIEKWYNVEIVYDSTSFRNNKLTVKLLEGEQLGKLLSIIETAVGAKCIYKQNKIFITKN